MEEEQELIVRLQRDAANEVICQNYAYLVGCVNAVLILPYLVSSKLVDQDFCQRLEGERTDKDKMMALLRELTRNPMECWFKEFIGALSKISQYRIVVDHLLKGALGNVRAHGQKFWREIYSGGMTVVWEQSANISTAKLLT